ncbi:MAG: carbohydrate-binding family 9-like protein [Pyrinomonadaceae bacterium]
MQKLNVNHTDNDLAVDDPSSDTWNFAEQVSISTYWNGDEAPDGRHFAVRFLWTDSALYVRFEANQAEPFIVAANPDVNEKAMNLWDRDVVEIFVAPDRNEPRKYFEFEAAPTGEWLDIALDSTSGERISDWDYASGMEAAAKIERDQVIIAIKIPWTAFGKQPKEGDVWLGNLLRCVGKDPDRGYLAWSPTMTEQPNFHVPERFGEFHFVK